VSKCEPGFRRNPCAGCLQITIIMIFLHDLHDPKSLQITIIMIFLHGLHDPENMKNMICMIQKAGKACFA